RHVAGTEPQLQNVGVRQGRNAVKDQIEQRESRRRWDEAIGPSLNERRVMEFVLRADKSAHDRFPDYRGKFRPRRAIGPPPEFPQQGTACRAFAWANPQ